MRVEFIQGYDRLPACTFGVYATVYGSCILLLKTPDRRDHLRPDDPVHYEFIDRAAVLDRHTVEQILNSKAVVRQVCPAGANG